MPSVASRYASGRFTVSCVRALSKIFSSQLWCVIISFVPEMSFPSIVPKFINTKLIMKLICILQNKLIGKQPYHIRGKYGALDCVSLSLVGQRFVFHRDPQHLGFMHDHLCEHSILFHVDMPVLTSWCYKYATANHTLIFIIFFLSISKRKTLPNFPTRGSNKRSFLSLHKCLASIVSSVHISILPNARSLKGCYRLNSRPTRRRQGERMGLSSFRLAEARRVNRSKARRRGEQQDSEIESAVSLSNSSIHRSIVLSPLVKFETIDIRLPSAGELVAATSKVSFERWVQVPLHRFSGISNTTHSK